VLLALRTRLDVVLTLLNIATHSLPLAAPALAAKLSARQLLLLPYSLEPHVEYWYPRLATNGARTLAAIAYQTLPSPVVQRSPLRADGFGSNAICNMHRPTLSRELICRRPLHPGNSPPS
jgi:hypothetical protein